MNPEEKIDQVIVAMNHASKPNSTRHGVICPSKSPWASPVLLKRMEKYPKSKSPKIPQKRV